MVDTGALRDLTIDAFRKNAIRSVILIDEQFPKYFQVGTEEYESSQSEICARLYREFNSHGFLCDVENDIEKVKDELTSQVTKSDLVVLDLHLKKGDSSDSTDSIEILDRLADSEHFNLVIVYTADKALDVISRRLAASLRGRSERDDDSEASDEITQIAAELAEEVGDLPVSLADDYLLPKRIIDPEINALKKAAARKCSDTRTQLARVLEILAERQLANVFSARFRDNCFRPLDDGNLAADNPWFVCGSVFVVVANKDETPPDEGKLVEVLDDAISDWNPGIVRCLLSEIQNCVTRAGLSYRSLVASDAITQLGWLLHAIEEHKEDGSQLSPAVLQLVERVLGSLLSHISVAPSLIDRTEKLLNTIEQKDSPIDRIRELCDANGMADMTPRPVFLDVLHALNEFLSTEEFAETQSYLTTGTVLRCECPDMHEWWLCVEPVCDTIPNQAGDNRFIRLRLLKLHAVRTILETLQEATHSRYVFTQHNETRMYFDSRDRTTDNHEIVEVFVSRDDQISWDEGMPSVKFWRTKQTEEPLSLVGGIATPITQLRRANADRLLHEAGYHLSRIGVDFVNCSEADAKLLKGNDNE